MSAANTAQDPAFGPGDGWEPVAVKAFHRPPAAVVHPDRSKGWLRRFGPLLWAHRWRFGFSLAGALVAMLIQVAVPAVIRLAVDDALVARTADLAPFLWVLLGLGVTRALITYAYRYGLYRSAFGMDTDLRVLLYGHLSRLSWGFYDRTPSGQLISRANSDIRSVQLFLTFAPLLLLTAVQFAVAVVFMVSIDAGLTVAAVVTLPAVFWLGVRLRNELFPLSWITLGRQADVATIVDENIGGVRVVRSFAAEERQVRELARAATALRWANVRTADARARITPVMENLPRLGMAIVLVYGGWLVIEGRTTAGTLFAFTAYVTQLQVPFRTLGMFLMLGQRAKASAERILEVLDEVPEIRDRPGAVDLLDPRGEVRFDAVRFGYGTDGPDVLDGFDLEIRAGETVALVGRTGSGKSTVARLLGRFYDPRDGAVRLDGRDVRDLTLPSLRGALSFAFDEPFLFSVSLRDNIAYARPGASLEDVVEAARIAQADEFIRALPQGYDTVVGERGYTLSGGQRQRVALARALLADPAVLVLDDATSAIDVQVEEAIHEALRRRLGRRTTLLIAHRLSTVSLADRVVLLEGGRVVAMGSHEELLDDPRYAQILASGERGRAVAEGAS